MRSAARAPEAGAAAGPGASSVGSRGSVSEPHALADRVLWHDLECGRYAADLALWLELARGADGPVLDVGAGTGRVTLPLARAGHEVVALDCEPAVLGALRARAAAAGLAVRAVAADARAFALDERFGLILAPMQTVQLLGSARGRARFLTCAAAHLDPGGLLAAALATGLEPFAPGDPLPHPDVTEHHGRTLCSQTVALQATPRAWIIERVRTVGGERAHHYVSLDRLAPGELELEARAHGLIALPRRHVPATDAHLGSEVVVLRRG